MDPASTRGLTRPQGRGTVAGGQWHHLSTQDSPPSRDTKSYQILPVSYHTIMSLELDGVFRSFAVTLTFLGKEPQGYKSKNLTALIQDTNERAGFQTSTFVLPVASLPWLPADPRN